ncbi:MAG: Ig-like domain-containing protein [Tannerellaceae bacterium]|nr:Ig-like domain-containing protein [Tannerellaceae bacterium]
MSYKGMQNGLLGLLVVFISLWIYSCANMASPSGGPYDEDPPKVVRTTPEFNQTNFTGKKVEIVFDELIQIENPNENVIITPPQRTMPVIRAQGKKVVVELRDTLKENTTYTIDFTSSIADNNEKNVLENFSFAFSTGDVIDSLEVSGLLLNARDLEPLSGITIGLHSNLEDSAFRTEPFLRISRTNERGQFTIRNIAPGTYRIYALNDMNRDYMFDQPGEEIAFLDSLITPSFELTARYDTVWVDSLTIDTIYAREFNKFIPDDIQLRLFKEEFIRQYMTRPDRSSENKFTLHFNEPVEQIPDPVPLNFIPEEEDWYFVQTADDKRTIHYWLRDSLLWQRDTLEMEVNYLRSDSMNILQPQLDTIQVILRNRPQAQDNKKKSKKGEEEETEIVFLGMNINATGTKEMQDTISVTFDEPVDGLSKDFFHLSQKADTLWNPVDFDFFPDTTNSLNYFIRRNWRYGEEYKLEVDSASIYSIYGKWNDGFSGEFKIRNKDEYGHLYIYVTGVDTTSFIELLNKSDAVVRKTKVVNGGALFMDLKPDTYYARLILDVNNNGEWDTGNYELKLQPEEVFYCPKPLEVMQHFEVEENWDVRAVPLEKQKPLDITKNKPKETTQRNRNR